MTCLDVLFRNLSLRRKNGLHRQPFSSKRRRQDASGEIETKVTKQFFDDDSAESSQEKTSKEPCLERTLDNISNDIIFEILSRLPAEFLWKVGRYVCKDWHKMILEPPFINSKVVLPSLLIDYFDKSESKSKSEFTLAHLDINSLSPVFELEETEVRYPGKVRFVSDGVLLIEHNNSLYAANPLTRQFVRLPSPFEEGHSIELALRYSCISRVPTTGKFKVLCFGCKFPNASRSCFMLTIGTDMKWTKAFDVPPGWFEHRLSRPCFMSIDGVVYMYDYWILKKQMLAIDLRTDDCALTLKIPTEIERGRSICVISRGMNCLGFVDINNEETNIWMLKDLYESKWEIVKSIPGKIIDSSTYSCHFWLDSYQMLVISRAVGQPILLSTLAYFANTGKWQPIYTGPLTLEKEIFMHSNSLVRI